MYNPAYLSLSRHSIYYFRWPLPKALRFDHKRTHVKLSLGTRNPDEALHLARVLEYHASLMVREHGPRLMNNSEVKAIVQDYCQRILEERKRQIRENGPMSNEQIASMAASIQDFEMVEQLIQEGAELEEDDMGKIIQTMKPLNIRSYVIITGKLILPLFGSFYALMKNIRILTLHHSNSLT